MSKFLVWVEKCQRSWVEVDASDEDRARDRAQDEARRPGWRPQWEGVSALTVKPIPDDPHPAFANLRNYGGNAD